MRTTVTLDEDVFHAARTMARASGQRLGLILSELARAGLRSRTAPAGRTRKADGLPRFEVDQDAPPISPQAVRREWENG